MLKKILNNATIMSWASYLTHFGSGLLVFPLLLKVYSDEVQSFWFLTETIAGLALMADMGFGSVLTRAASYFKAGSTYLPKNKKEYEEAPKIEKSEPNFQKLKDLLTTSFTVYYILTAVSIIVISTAGTYFIKNVINLAGNPRHLWIAFILLIPYVAISMNGVKWRAFIRGMDFIVIEARFSTFVGAIKIIIFLVLLSLKMQPMYLVGTLLLLEIFRFFYLKRFVLNWFAENKVTFIKKRFFDREIFNSLWVASWRLGGIFWGNYFIEKGNDILVSQVSNPKLMASFLITGRILSYIKQFSQITLYSITPKIYMLSAQKKLKELREIASGYMFLGVFLMTGGTLALVLFGDPVLSLFSSSRLVPTGLLIIMGLTALFDMHASFHASIYTSTNHIPFLIPALVSGAVIFILGYFFLPLYGIVALIWLRFLVQIAFNHWYSVVLSLRLLQWPFGQYLYELPVLGTKYMVARIKGFIHKV